MANHASLLLRQGVPGILSSASNPHLALAKWMFGCTGLVGGIVHVGGITRLTKSGLSMTDWKPLGSLPPLKEAEWEEEFERYKQYPEFSQRQRMTMAEFQHIYYWEWGHRMLGRTVGVCFALPWGFFMWKRMIPAQFQPKFAMLFTLGGAQGLVGWWMVRSGLGEDRRDDRKEIRVSPYRLAAHLSVAATTFSLLLWTSLDLLHLVNRDKIKLLAASLKSRPYMDYAKKCRAGAITVTGLTAVTLVSGAFVAGNDAGRAYNTFPKMTPDRWIPWEDLNDPLLKPAYKNIFENTALVQLNHRILGVTTAVSAITLSAIGLCHPAMRSALTPQALRGIKLLGGVATAQASLGITTLLTFVPITLGAAHQLGSLALMSSGIYLVHSLRYTRSSVLKNVTKFVK